MTQPLSGIPIDKLPTEFDVTLEDSVLVQSQTSGTVLVRLEDLPPLITIGSNVLLDNVEEFPSNITNVMDALVYLNTLVKSLTGN